MVLAVFNPDPAHLAEQLASLAAQTGVGLRVHAVIADLTSSALVTGTARAAGLEVAVVVPLKSLSAVAAFSYGLEQALEASEPGDLFALCDQDDVWDPDKLAVTVAALRAKPGCHLAHTDARLIAADGRAMAPSLFAVERRELRFGLRRLLYRNAITGMTAVCTRELLQHALPMPAQNGVFFYHDLWLGLVAAAKGPVAVVRRATVSYRQHDKNAVGAVIGLRGPLPLSTAWLRQRFGSFSLACYLAKSLIMRADQMSRCEPGAFDRTRLRALRPYLRNHGVGAAFFWDAAGYALRGRRELADHSFSQGVVKLGRLVWAARRMLSRDLSNRLREFDDIGYQMAPGVPPSPAATPGQGRGPAARAQQWTSLVDRRRSMSWNLEVIVGQPTCNILVPTLNPTEIFAGIATALHLGVGLAQRGVAVRFVATDLPMVSRHASHAFIASLASGEGRADTLSRIDLHCGVTSDSLTLSPADNVVATAWWTAHLAQRVIADPRLAAQRFYYLVQDYEPNFYAWGTEYAAAVESYDMACTPIFNTTLLRDFFAQEGHSFDGVSAHVFRPSIDVAQFADLTRIAGRRKRRVAVYGRPEVPRNMFPVCVEALATFLEAEDLQPSEVEIVSVGLSHDPVALPNGVVLTSLGKLAADDYPLFLTTVDVGLSLMYSPHPSHVPLEMAAAGARVVTNGFGPKDLSRLSPLIRSVAPRPDDVAEGLRQAWAEAATPASRAARDIDLDQLGPPLSAVASAMAAEFAPAVVQKPVPMKVA